MFQRAVVTHISHSVQVCISLVNIVHIGAVVLFIQDACGIMGNIIYKKPLMRIQNILNKNFNLTDINMYILEG